MLGNAARTLLPLLVVGPSPPRQRSTDPPRMVGSIGFATAGSTDASLPAFLPPRAEAIAEPEARAHLSRMTRVDVEVATDGARDDTNELHKSVATAFRTLRPGDAGSMPAGPAGAALSRTLRARLAQFRRDQPMQIPPGLARGSAQASHARPPRVLLLHGADASSLEWRFLMPRLAALGVETVAVDWWSGGFTEREPMLRALDGRCPATGKLLRRASRRAASSDGPARAASVRPWDLVRQHLHAFWEAQLGAEPVILVGASLGGAVALDFAASHPEAVAGLVLLDAGGQSYKSPPPAVVSALSPVALGVKKVLAVGAARLKQEEPRINALHRSEPSWLAALGAYLASGGYARRVGPDLIRTVAQPTLVVWGTDDPILPLEDAYAFQRDLKHCVAVREVAGCGHTPQLEDPDTTAAHVAQFVHELAG